MQPDGKSELLLTSASSALVLTIISKTPLILPAGWRNEQWSGEMVQSLKARLTTEKIRSKLVPPKRRNV